MKLKHLFAGLIASVCVNAHAQAPDTESPKGQAIIQVFGNFHTGFGHNNDDRGFDLDRSYLGYEYKLNNNLSVKGVIDIGKSSKVDDYHRIAYIKNAQISWKTGNFTLNGGLISTTQFNFQEKFWGYRYIMKSFQDQYKFGNSADLGISATLKFNDIVSADAIIVNGEGYKKIQVNDGLNYGLGFTITPIKGLYLRVYGGINETSIKNQKDILNLATFVGYKHQKFTIGAEYNLIKNSQFLSETERKGYSVFGSLKLSNATELYARYDEVFSEDSWDMRKDESSAIIGAQFKLGKYVKIAPNFRASLPKHTGENNYSAFVSCYFGL